MPVSEQRRRIYWKCVKIPFIYFNCLHFFRTLLYFWLRPWLNELFFSGYLKKWYDSYDRLVGTKSSSWASDSFTTADAGNRILILCTCLQSSPYMFNTAHPLIWLLWVVIIHIVQIIRRSVIVFYLLCNKHYFGLQIIHFELYDYVCLAVIKFCW